MSRVRALKTNAKDDEAVLGAASVLFNPLWTATEASVARHGIGVSTEEAKRLRTLIWEDVYSRIQGSLAADSESAGDTAK